VITGEVGFACLPNDIDPQCESNGDKSTSERPLQDPVGGEPKASGDPSPGEANEDRPAGKNEKEGRRHKYGVGYKRLLGAGEGHIIGVTRVTTACSSVARKGQRQSPRIVVLGDGAARI